MPQDQSFYLEEWSRLVELLRSHSSNPNLPPVTLSSTRQQVRDFHENAVLADVELPEPDFTDPAFDGLQFGPNVGQPITADPSRPATHPITLPIIADVPDEEPARTQAIIELKKARAVARRRIRQIDYVLRKVSDEKSRSIRAAKEGRIPVKFDMTLPCGCGCGEGTHPFVHHEGDVHYKQGHIFRYVFPIMRVERGMTRSSLPTELRKRITWIRCEKCKGLIPSTDPFGRPIKEKIGLACWRKLFKVWWPYEGLMGGTKFDEARRLKSKSKWRRVEEVNVHAETHEGKTEAQRSNVRA